MHSGDVDTETEGTIALRCLRFGRTKIEPH
jgi:hypothetical protein